MSEVPALIVLGLRDHVAEHWQTLLWPMHMSARGPSRHFVRVQQSGRFRSEADIT